MLRYLLIFFLLFVTFMSLKPRSVEMGLEVNDKIGHALAYFVLTANSVLVFGTKQRIRIALLLLIYGLLIEFLQGLIPGRVTSFYDLIANATGISVAIVFLAIFGNPVRRIFTRIGIDTKS